MNNNDFIKQNWEKLSDSELAENTGLSISSIEHRRRRMGLKRAARNATMKLDDSIQGKVLSLIKKSPQINLVELSNAIDVSPAKIALALDSLKNSGHNILPINGGFELSAEIQRTPPTIIPIKKLTGRKIKFGLTADNHLGSKYERMDVLNALFDIWESEGVDTVYQLGNMIEGERHSKFDIHTHGLQGQVDYFVKNWPQRKGIVTKFVTGDDHEGWYVQDTGINIGSFIQLEAEKVGRNDLVYLGHMEHDILYEGTEQTSVMRLIHAGGGSSYATSYSVQKIVESYQGGEKPKILLVGHYHKAEYGYPREVHVVQAGTTKDQDSFLRKNKIASHIGGWIIEFVLTPEGDITRFKTEWIPFYDRDYYEKKWQYRW